MPKVINGAFAQVDEHIKKLTSDTPEALDLFPGLTHTTFFVSPPDEFEVIWHGTFEFYNGGWPGHEYVEALTFHGLLGKARTVWDEEIRSQVEEALAEKEKALEHDTKTGFELE